MTHTALNPEMTGIHWLRRSIAAALIAIARPYIRRELPGWGYIYRNLIGDYRRDWLWQDQHPRWVRGKLHGYEMLVEISGWSNRVTFFLERFYDLPTQLLIMAWLRPGDLFVDVGANEGMMSLLAAARVGPSGRVIAFEPNPVPREKLRQGIARNAITRIDLREFGLGERDATLSLFVPSINTGEGTFTATDSNDGVRIEAQVRAGDAELANERPRLVKIDVEGFEFHVISGLRRMLGTDRPMVVMEVIAGHLARDGQTPAAIIAAMVELGYEARRLGLRKCRGKYHAVLEPVSGPWNDGDYVFATPEDIVAFPT